MLGKSKLSAATRGSDFATHLSVLRAIPQYLEIRRVLEFGGGDYSTSLFLDRDIYSGLEHLRTVETNLAWLVYLKTSQDDTRFTISNCAGWESIDVNQYDLIFIDDGETIRERVRTIECVVALHPSCPVVIHDFEQPAYRKAALAGMPYAIEFTRRTPTTAICYGDNAQPKSAFAKLDAVRSQL